MCHRRQNNAKRQSLVKSITYLQKVLLHFNNKLFQRCKKLRSNHDYATGFFRDFENEDEGNKRNCNLLSISKNILPALNSFIFQNFPSTSVHCLSALLFLFLFFFLTSNQKHFLIFHLERIIYLSQYFFLCSFTF